MHWSDKYVGQPYIAETGDCAALAERVAREVFGKIVGLPTSHATGYREQAKQILALQDDYAVKIDAPVDGCPLLGLSLRGACCAFSETVARGRKSVITGKGVTDRLELGV